MTSTMRPPADHRRAVVSDSIGGTHRRAVASDSIGGGAEPDLFFSLVASLLDEDDQSVCRIRRRRLRACNPVSGSNNYAPQESLSHSRAHYPKPEFANVHPSSRYVRSEYFPQPHHLVPMLQQEVFQSGRVYHGRNVSDVPMSGISGSMLATHFDLGSTLLLDTNKSQPINIEILASSLTNATPEQKWRILRQKLYPLVDHLAHDHAEKITGMILEMDQKDILHLLVSPDTLRVKVSEAMEVLRCAIISALVDASPEQQRMMLREKLFPLVDRLAHDHSAKVTDMILEMDEAEVLFLLEMPDALKTKVSKALEIINNIS